MTTFLAALIIALSVGFFPRLNLPGATSSASASAIQHDLYVFVDGTIYVYDEDNGFALVKTISLPETLAGGRGIAASTATGMLFVSYGGDGGINGTNGSVLAYNLLTDKVAWITNYSHGIDSITVTPDGKTLYVPGGAADTANLWYVVDASNGNQITTINAGGGAHNTVMGSNGQYVYLGGLFWNYLKQVSTSTNQVTQTIGPYVNGVRPFTVNGSDTLAFTTSTDFLGFEVSSIQTGQVLYTVPIKGFTCCPPTWTANAPSHGISLSPDEREIYVIDAPNSYVHVFDVTGLPNAAPVQVADISLNTPMGGTESPCAYDCTQEGWLMHSIDGGYVYVGDSGDVIDTQTRQIVTNLPELAQTRQFIEIDWANGVPIAASQRESIGRVTTPPGSATATALVTATPAATMTSTPTPSPTLTPTRQGSDLPRRTFLPSISS
ncbi:MAG TPA: hypothetical protein VMW65_04765 [Chloroflexota bacterium]|nr:hypothetical protein [Chloroflexota bacterium]